jgi:light-regulated signal transduction histidine kinase (bacteriophytochrome)
MSPASTNFLVDADLTRLVQVFSNLLANAAKSTEPGGTVNIAVDSGDNIVHVRSLTPVWGIDPALLPQIFDLLVEGENTLDRNAIAAELLTAITLSGNQRAAVTAARLSVQRPCHADWPNWSTKEGVLRYANQVGRHKPAPPACYS